MRSQIALNPYNPKRHTDEKVKFQKKNLKEIGLLGGIVWNEQTGRLIDGHRRIMALDSHYKYDGTPDTDYRIPVSVVSLDEKREKEQLTYMALGNTKADFTLVADCIKDIDYGNIGLSDAELTDILSILPEFHVGTFDDIVPVSTPTTPTTPTKGTPEYEAAKEKIKEAKSQVFNAGNEKDADKSSYVTLSFSTYEAKAAFCDLLGISDEAKYAKGEDVIGLIS